MTRADTSVEIHDLIAERRSPRSLDATATIENQDLLALLEAARWAPSANNLQPWRLIAGGAVFSIVAILIYHYR